MGEKTKKELMEEYLDEWEEKGGSYYEFEYDEKNDSVAIIDIYVRSEHKLVIPDFVSKIYFDAWYRNRSDRAYRIFIPKGCELELYDNYGYSVSTQVKHFEVDEEHELYSSDEGVLYNKDKTEMLAYPLFKGDGIFEKKEYVIPESVIKIGKNAYNIPMCLNKLTITKNLIDIRGAYFSAGTEIIVDEENTAFKSVNGSLYSKDGKILYSLNIDENGKATIEEGTIIVSDYFDMGSCEELYIASTVKLIDNVEKLLLTGDIEHCIVPKNLKKMFDEYKNSRIDIKYY